MSKHQCIHSCSLSYYILLWKRELQERVQCSQLDQKHPPQTNTLTLCDNRPVLANRNTSNTPYMQRKIYLHFNSLFFHSVLGLPAYSNLSLHVSYQYLPTKTSVACVLSSVISISMQPSKFATYQQVPAYIGQGYPQLNDGTAKTWHLK